MHRYTGNSVLGILRECHGMWERRSPLSPTQVQSLLKHLPSSAKVLIQPCTRRIYSNEEYRQAGADITEDLSPASIIVGVKSPPKNILLRDKMYMFFSHTIKAQPYSMPLLDTVLDKNICLFDYEGITKAGRDDTPRLVAFGKYAGRAGMIDGLQGLGLRLLAEGFSTPFLHIPNTFMHASLQEASDALRRVGRMITEKGLPPSLTPLVITFTGTGNVAKGAKEIFELFPHQYISPEELPHLKAQVEQGLKPRNILYGVECTSKNFVRPKNGSKFIREEYYRHPQEHEAIFHETVLPYTHLLVNGIYWDNRFPRLVTKEQLKKLRATGNRTLRAVADISCDIEGSVEFLSRPSTIEKPFYSYDPEKAIEEQKVSGSGILMLGVDNLPSELPRDASEHFGERLLPLLPPLLTWKGSRSQEDIASSLPPELYRACLTSHGHLMPKWNYIARLREQTAVLTTSAIVSQPKAHLRIQMTGHLFDTGLINQILDIIEQQHDVNASIVNADIRNNSSAGAQHSRLLLELTGGDPMKVQILAETVCKMVNEHKKAEGEATVLGQENKEIKVTMPKRILLFGSGRVAMPVAKLFSERENVHLTIATEDESQAKTLIDMMKGNERASFVQYRYPQDNNKLSELIRQADIVISLLPATMHVPIAKEAVLQRRHMVTASYVSPEMKALHESAVEAGVILLNEIGLDPGMDHMMIMQAIDEIRRENGKVVELVSLCGGLPDPVAAENPLRYKFSWSPRGVLNAAGNAASYMTEGKMIKVEGENLLKAATPSQRFPTLRLEVLPNRDALIYRDLYQVHDVKSICRGTLRYEGWSNVMYALKTLGLFSPATSSDVSAIDIVQQALGKNSDLSLSAFREYFSKHNVSDIDAAIDAVDFLGLSSNSDAMAIEKAKGKRGKSAIEALCNLLEDRLQFKAGEKDMVAMFHKITGEMPDGRLRTYLTRLLTFGVPGGDSAMSMTVGYTTAAAAEHILFDGLADTDIRGVVIPTDQRIYEPILKRIQQFGITWTETVTTAEKTLGQEQANNSYISNNPNSMPRAAIK